MGSRLFIGTVLGLFVSTTALSDTNPKPAATPDSGIVTSAQVGGETIMIPAPQGFCEISEISPETRKLYFEEFVAPSNRLLACWVTQGDAGTILQGADPTLGRYMTAQAFRKAEGVFMPSDKFLEMKDMVRKQQGGIDAKTQSEVAELLRTASGKVSDRLKAGVSLKVEKSLPLGVFLDKEDAIGFVVLVKYQVTTDGQEQHFVTVGSTTFMRVRGKVLFVYVFAGFGGQADIDWAKTTTAAWVDKIQAMNGFAGEAGNSNGSGSSWNGILQKVAVGAILGVVAAGIGFLRAAKKRRASALSEGGVLPQEADDTRQQVEAADRKATKEDL